jgi:hypothetical protein
MGVLDLDEREVHSAIKGDSKRWAVAALGGHVRLDRIGRKG